MLVNEETIRENDITEVEVDDDDDNLFSDVGDDEADEGDEEVASDEEAEEVDNPEEVEEEESTEEGDESSKDDKTYEVKFLGKMVPQTLEQLKTNAQMGMNYPKVLEERDSLRALVEPLKALAKEAGLEDLGAYITSLNDSVLNTKIDKRAEELQKEGLSEVHSRRMAELELKAVAKPAQEVKKSTPEEDELRVYKENFNELFEAFPETKDILKLEDYPEEFQTLLAQGVKPLVAYSKAIAKQATNEKAIALQNLKNKKRDGGSLKNSQKQKTLDDFESGFNS